ncbi:MAG: hypothetical protein ACRC4T_06540 [Cetobacterium sp.]
MLKILNIIVIIGIILSFSLGIIYYFKFKKIKVMEKKTEEIKENEIYSQNKVLEGKKEISEIYGAFSESAVDQEDLLEENTYVFKEGEE